MMNMMLTAFDFGARMMPLPFFLRALSQFTVSKFSGFLHVQFGKKVGLEVFICGTGDQLNFLYGLALDHVHNFSLHVGIKLPQ